MRFSSSSSKPLSSPGRTDKFPPPLMRFLRTNPSSKSHRARSRSRSSPMFITRKRSSIEPSTRATAKIPEPSSPKVTCMGQVRVRRSKPPKSNRRHGRNPRKASSSVCRCQWLVPFPKALFWRPKLSRPALGKLASFFQLSFRRKPDTREINSVGSSVGKIEPGFVEGHESEESEGFAVASPPKNALILTRCRSAPYRSSSLARRFWESPLKGDAEEEEEPEEPKKSVKIDGKFDGKPPTGGEEEEGPKKEGQLGLRFAVLTRCNSEPARTGEKKLGTEPEFGCRKTESERDRGRRRRFGFVD